jgi:anti-sigma factor (TIGR02949 family)
MSEMNQEHDPVHDDIGCLEAIEWLYAWLDGELDSDSIEQLEHHLQHCQSCYSRNEMERALTARIKEASGEKTPASLNERLNRLLDEF